MSNRFTFFLVLLLVLGFGSLLVLPTTAAEPPDAKQIAKLVDQLNSDKFAEREKAAQQLDAIGEPALEALQKAAKSDQTELRRRAEELIKKIEGRTQGAKILKAKKVSLTYKDTPLKEAIEDFKKKSG